MAVRRIVGTAEDCDLRVEDSPYLSARHFSITRHDNGVVTVRDEGSTNGTSVYAPGLGWFDARIEPIPLIPGSKIHAGKVLFKIAADGQVEVVKDVSLWERNTA